ncbi:hypothetical protein BC941DRAFT_464384 [Chlamydoabsidia padenii]|nr:hypothetical protein BC941DRAFT_464384 [Chlamydoabsidia padenii]
MQDSSNWAPSSSQASSYGHPNYSYATNYVSTPNGNAPSSSTLMSLSQPNTPRPEANLAVTQNEGIDDDTTHKTRSEGRASSFSTTSFQSTPYPTSLTRRRRTESSMYAYETGPSFTQTKQLLDIWNMDQTNGHQLQLHVKLERGFFRADQDWTCYRRNYFQVSATFDVHGISYLVQGSEVPCLVQSEQRQLFQVDYFSIGVSACVSGSDKKIDLIQHTPKRDKGPQMIPQPRALRSGGNLHLAPVGSNHNIVTFERMQFKTATANNGKRRAAQQYYEIIVTLYANSSNGSAFPVATCTSAPLVVRGRSPGHYADFNSRYRGVDPASVNADAAAVAAATGGGIVVGHPVIPGHYGPPPALGPLPPQASGMNDRYHQGPSRFMSLPTSPTHDFGSYQAYAPSFYPPIMPPPPSTTIGSSISSSSSSGTRIGYPESDYVISSSPYAHAQPQHSHHQHQQQQQGYCPPSQTTPITSPTEDNYASISSSAPSSRQTVVYGDQTFKPPVLSPPDAKSNVIHHPSSTPQPHPPYYPDQYHHHQHQPPSSSSASPYVGSSSSYSSYADSNNTTTTPTKLQHPYASSTMDKSSSADAGRPTK